MKVDSKQIKEMFEHEKAKETKKSGSISLPNVPHVVSPPTSVIAHGHESVSNRSAKEAENPSVGSLGHHEGETMEEAIPASSPVLESASAIADEEFALDAYWASYGTAETRVAMRIPNLRDSMREVVIGADDRVRVANTDSYPWRCIASLRITAADGSNWIGTAWLVSPRLMLTAGHCVYMHDRGGWVSRIEVIPGRDGSNHPHGSCVTTDFRSVRGWTQDREREFDYGAILLPESCRFGDALGWFGFEALNDDEIINKTVNISGYPGDKPVGTQWFHSNTVTDVDDRVFTYEVDTAGGQSGAPVWLFKPEVGRYGIGIHTNGSLSGNSATRITGDVFDNIIAWRDEVP